MKGHKIAPLKHFNLKEQADFDSANLKRIMGEFFFSLSSLVDSGKDILSNFTLNYQTIQCKLTFTNKFLFKKSCYQKKY